MKRSKVLIILAVLAALALGRFHRAVYMSFRNMTVKSYEIPEKDTWSGGKTYRNVRYSEVSPSDYLDLYLPENSEGGEKPRLFVIIHGGGFVSGDSTSRQAQLMYRFFRDRGYACASIHYRLAQEAAFPAGVEDCKAAVRYLRANADKYGYNADQITVFGESAGGYLALMCSVTGDDEFNSVPFIGQTDSHNPSSKIDILVDYYGYTDITGLDKDLKAIGLPRIVYTVANYWMIGKMEGYEDFASYWFRKNVSEMSESERNVVDPYYYIGKNKDIVTDLAVWMVHGDCDLTIPYLSSARLYDCLSGVIGQDDIYFRLEQGMGHAGDPLYSDEILSEMDDFIRGHLS